MADGLSSNKVHFISQESDGVMWLGTSNGLVRYEQGTFTAYNLGEDGFSPDLRAFCRDREGTFWLGSRIVGLARLRRGHFTSYTTKDGLPDDYVGSVIQDRNGTMWTGTGKGLTVLRDGRVRRAGPLPTDCPRKSSARWPRIASDISGWEPKAGCFDRRRR